MRDGGGATIAGVLIFDAHFHIVDPRFPLVENQGFRPDSYVCEAYLADVVSLGVTGGAVVSGSFQAFDQSYLEDALARLGPSFVGVTELPTDASEDTIVRLDGLGVRAVRFNLVRGGAVDVASIERLARRVYETAGWHAELYVDSRQLDSLSPLLDRLPRVVVDHLGLFQAGFAALLRLVERGAFVKATGFGRVDMNVAESLVAITNVRPDALIFGTDLPSTRAPRPFRHDDVDLIRDALGKELACRVLEENAVALYRPRRVAPR